ncbi:uncharacterized protein LOC129752431 [Uranotaenia lowii]|uniref:uncharacterized protein LOC129752431 n=1 Tax=Uranotaenia lowii TaxID=190385 RepID=UPI002479945E|nr:uncharacterized protein LOC129752431 [Uranotaenia lowii]
MLGVIESDLHDQLSKSLTKVKKSVYHQGNGFDLKGMRKFHLKLYNLLEELNILAGPFVFVILGEAYFNLNIDFIALLGDLEDNDTFQMIEMWSFVLFRLAKVLAIVVPNSLVKSKNRKIAVTLCKLADLDNPNIPSSEIDNFLRQISELSDVHWICGTVQLGMPLLVTMFSLLTTYMVILIQFEPGKNKHE